MSSRNRSGWFGAVVLIAVGVVGMAVNFNLVPREFLSQLWKLWPVVPLAIGIGILLRRPRSGEAPSQPDKP